MNTVKISVNQTNVTVSSACGITAGTVGVPYEMAYDPSWDGLQKIVVFSNGEITRNAVNGIIPREVLTEPTKLLRVGIVGRKSDGSVVIPTVWGTVGLILPGAEESGDPTLDPENPVWAQSAAMASEALEMAKKVKSQADSGAFLGAKGDTGPAGKSAYQAAQAGGYGGTEEKFENGLMKAVNLFEKDTSGWSPVTELDGAAESWQTGYCWDSSGEKSMSAQTKGYFASAKFPIPPDCDYEITGLQGQLYLYDAGGRNGTRIFSENPAQSVKFHAAGDRKFAAVNSRTGTVWTPRKVMLIRNTVSKAEQEAFPAYAQQLKPLYGKKIVCFGDGLFGKHRGITSAPAYAGLVCGAVMYNVGFGGCRMAADERADYGKFSMWELANAAAAGDWSGQNAAAAALPSYFLEQLELLESIDFSKMYGAVIHYGTNDFTADIPLDMGESKNCASVCGALRSGIETLQTAFPGLRIYISLPVYRYWTEGGSTVFSEDKVNGQGIRLPDVCAALESVAKEYHCPVIDGYNGLHINRVNASAFLEDGTCHNQPGRERFGTLIGRRLLAE